MNHAYDLIVIGSGPAGQSAAELAAFLGHSALVVERGEPGGVVTTTGGAPTKTLREIAMALSSRRRLAGASDRPASLADALPIVRTQTLAACRSLQQIVREQIESRGAHYVQGAAQLAAGGIVSITEPGGRSSAVAAKAIVLAPGSRPFRFAGIPFDDPDIYDSNEIFSMRRTPKDIVIVGGGPVGIEFATIFTELGVPVTLVEHGNRLLPSMDGELVTLMGEEFRRRGVRVMLRSGVESASRQNGALSVTFTGGNQMNADAILFAAGRVANTDGLDLPSVGVELDARGRIVVDRYFRTTGPGIYAAGDAVNPTLASVAMQQGRAAVCHAFGLVFGVPVDHAVSAAVYGLPEIAGVGMTEEQIAASGTPFVVGRCDLARTARGAIA